MLIQGFFASVLRILSCAGKKTPAGAARDAAGQEKCHFYSIPRFPGYTPSADNGRLGN
jgi:hypothetical protein